MDETFSLSLTHPVMFKQFIQKLEYATNTYITHMVHYMCGRTHGCTTHIYIQMQTQPMLHAALSINTSTARPYASSIYPPVRICILIPNQNLDRHTKALPLCAVPRAFVILKTIKTIRNIKKTMQSGLCGNDLRCEQCLQMLWRVLKTLNL